jgi:hypothetical protein
MVLSFCKSIIDFQPITSSNAPATPNRLFHPRVGALRYALQ